MLLYTRGHGLTPERWASVRLDGFLMTLMGGLNCDPPPPSKKESYVEVLTPHASQGLLVWKQGLEDVCDRFRQALLESGGRCHEEGSTLRHREAAVAWRSQRWRLCSSCKPGNAMGCQQPQKVGRPDGILPCGFVREPRPGNTLVFDLQPSEL